MQHWLTTLFVTPDEVELILIQLALWYSLIPYFGNQEGILHLVDCRFHQRRLSFSVDCIVVDASYHLGYFFCTSRSTTSWHISRSLSNRSKARCRGVSPFESVLVTSMLKSRSFLAISAHPLAMARWRELPKVSASRSYINSTKLNVSPFRKQYI